MQQLLEKAIDILDTSSPPPAQWVNEIPEAFGGADELGNVYIIGYRGEWYRPLKPSPRVRLHNWLVSIWNRRYAPDGAVH